MSSKLGKLEGFKILLLGFLGSLSTILPARAAEYIYLNYGAFNFSLSVEALTLFAQEGKVTKELAFYLNRLSPQKQNQLRAFLRARYDVKPIILYRLGQTYAGDQLLTILGKAIQLPGGRNGYYAIRGAIIYSSTTPEGVSVINVLRNFSTNIQLDMNFIVQSIGQISSLIKETQILRESLNRQSGSNITSIDESKRQTPLDLQKTGGFTISQEILKLYDTQRDRPLTVVIYLPQSQQSEIPVIVISNGLGAHRDRFSFLARHLASHGFAVVIPDHPNSNDQRQQDFYEGLYKEPFDATEFTDRPLDVSYTLDQLEKLNQTQFQGKLNLKQVGIFGYSFGGTTAFALGGARINFTQLKQDCQSPNGFLNLSILYQCRALEIPPKNYDLQDTRIKAAFVFVPFGKSLYGQIEMQRINIPIFWQATDEDVITPLLNEQVPAFNWLPLANKYLAISEKLPHTRVILNTMNQWGNQTVSAENLIQVTQNYLNAMSLAFFQVYIAQEDEYHSYLQPSYTQVLSETPFNLHLLRQLPLPDVSLPQGRKNLGKKEYN